MSHPQLINSTSRRFYNWGKTIGKKTSGNQESKPMGSQESKYMGRSKREIYFMIYFMTFHFELCSESV